jgi:hypothetical protein
VSAEPVMPYVPLTEARKSSPASFFEWWTIDERDRSVAKERLDAAEILDVDLVRVAPAVTPGACLLQRVDRHETRRGMLVEPGDDLLLEALADLRRRPADLEPVAWHRPPFERVPQAHLTAPLAVLERQVQDVALLDRPVEELAADGDLDRDLIDEARLADLRRCREDGRSLGDEVAARSTAAAGCRARAGRPRRSSSRRSPRPAAGPFGTLRGGPSRSPIFAITRSKSARRSSSVFGCVNRGATCAPDQLPQLVDVEARVVAARDVVADGRVAAARRDPLRQREAAVDDDRAGRRRVSVAA